MRKFISCLAALALFTGGSALAQEAAPSAKADIDFIAAVCFGGAPKNITAYRFMIEGVRGERLCELTIEGIKGEEPVVHLIFDEGESFELFVMGEGFGEVSYVDRDLINGLVDSVETPDYETYFEDGNKADQWPEAQHEFAAYAALVATRLGKKH